MNSGDPFNMVKAEVKHSLQTLQDHFRIWEDTLDRNQANLDDLEWTSKQIGSELSNIEWDLQDLEETIRIVEQNPKKFNVDVAELQLRRKFISDTRNTVKNMKVRFNSPEAQRRQDEIRKEQLSGKANVTRRRGAVGNSGKQSMAEAIQRGNEQFMNNQQLQQETMIRQQDEDLTDLSKAVKRIGNLGREMNRELEEQHILLDELDEEIDETSGRFANVQKKLEDLINSQSAMKQCFIIMGLMLLFIALTTLVIIL